MANLLARPDTQSLLKEFIGTAFDVLAAFTRKEERNTTLVQGIMNAMSMLFQKCPRELLLSDAAHFIDKLDWDVLLSSSTVIRKAAMKLLQRLCLTQLAPIPNHVRYRQERRVIFRDGANKELGATIPELLVEDADTREDVPECVDSVIARLLAGLGDGDTVVRWCCAKGVGRIAQRLPWDFVDDIFVALLESLGPTAAEPALHGGCFALAEVLRRGGVHPDRIAELVAPIKRALTYDEPRGATSVGANVRDASCYVCWSLARAFSASCLTPCLELGKTLLAIAVFDRYFFIQFPFPFSFPFFSFFSFLSLFIF